MVLRLETSHRTHSRIQAIQRTNENRFFKQNDTLVTNMRHFESLRETRKALDEVLTGMDNDVPGDLLAQDIRQSLYHLGEITGDISTDDLLDNIFSKFCIGK